MIEQGHDRIDQCALTLRELSELVSEAQRYFFGRGDLCILDRSYVMGKLNDLNGSLPESFRQAEQLIADMKTLRAQANSECESILAKAREQGRQLEAEAQQALDKANGEAQQIRASAELAAQEGARKAEGEAARIIAEAKQQAEKIRQDAEQQLREAVSRENVQRVAQVEADEIREQTRKEMNELHDNVFDYLDGVMGEIERFLGTNLQSVRNERKELNDHRFVK